MRRRPDRCGNPSHFCLSARQCRLSCLSIRTGSGVRSRVRVVVRVPRPSRPCRQPRTAETAVAHEEVPDDWEALMMNRRDFLRTSAAATLATSPVPTIDDELHHFGWNICSSCHGDALHERRYLIIPGLRSSRIHIVDAADPKALKPHKTIEPEVIHRRANLSAPHTVHCLADGTIMISMLGDAAGNGPGGFLLLDPNFEVIGRWEKSAEGMHYNYDFWYQTRHNVM